MQEPIRIERSPGQSWQHDEKCFASREMAADCTCGLDELLRRAARSQELENALRQLTERVEREFRDPNRHNPSPDVGRRLRYDAEVARTFLGEVMV